MSKIVKKRLGDIINFKRGYDLPSYNRIEGEYPIISSSGISGYHSEYKKEGEGLITGRYGTLGEVYYINGRYWPHNTALYVTDFKNNYPKYAYFLMKCLGNLKTSDKSTVPGINRNDLHELIVPFIRKEFQKPLADFLFNIEEKIELNNRINAELEAMAKTLYDYWFVQFDFPDANGKPYKTSGGKMVWNEELKREIPAGWRCLTLGKVVASTGTGLNPRDNFILGEGNNYYVTIRNIEQGRVILDNKCDKISDESIEIINKRSDLKVGDILFTSIEPVGTTYLILEKPKNWNINESVFTIRPNYEKVTSEFLYMFLSGDYIKSYTKNVSAGSIHKGVRHSVLKDCKFILPVRNIVDEYTLKVQPILKKFDLIQKQNQHLSSLRDWLLPMLMNGQVTVGEKEKAVYQAEEELGMAAEPEGETE